MKEGGWPDFFQHGCDENGLILIDDIDLLAGRDRWAEVEAFFQSLPPGCRILCTIGDVSLVDRIGKILPPVFHRISVKIEPLDLPAKLSALQRLSDKYGSKFPDDALYYLALHTGANHRTLASHVIRIGAYQSLSQQPIDVAMVADYFKRAM